MSESNSISAGNISSGTVIAGDKNIVGNNNVIQVQKDDSEDWEQFYLRRLINTYDRLDITAVDETCFRQGQEAGLLRVSDVFTTLYLKDISRLPKQSVADAILRRGNKERMSGEEKEEAIPIHATEAVGNPNRLVILGRPGGGKSTLLNHIAVQLAKCRLNECRAINRPAISETPLKRAEDREVDFSVLPGWSPDLKPLPVMIILRTFAAWISENRKKSTQNLISAYMEEIFRDICKEDVWHSLKLRLDQKDSVIFFFDGLDEVRESDEEKHREMILHAIREFAESFDQCRIIVTCREYAYQNKTWRLPESLFPVVELDVFRSEQIQQFTRTWYRITGHWKGWSDERCENEAENLFQAIEAEAQHHLKSLAESPLLLTLMAQVHGRDGYLPKDRADLYERAVNLLLAHWEIKIVRNADGTCSIEPGIVPTLNIRLDTLRRALEEVAIAAHERQETEKRDTKRCADISKAELREVLGTWLDNDFNKAGEVIGYIQNRAGLLISQDNRIFTFPHRTFQEFLAGTGIMRKGDFELFLHERVSRDIAWWQEVFLLAAGSSRNTPKNIYDLINELLPDDPDDTEISSEIAKFAGLAARAMGETDFSKQVQIEKKSKRGKYSKIHERVQNWLLTAMTADKVLTPEERCEAGNALNWVGDPRFDPNNFYLPYDDDMSVSGFITIPAGSFMMGSDKKRDKNAYDNEFPQHKVRLSAYSIGRYPVTVAQFRVFMQDSGYQVDDDDWEKYNRFDNHPVVEVSWNDAVAYCEWLIGKLQDRGWKIRLPTEAEWEYAARGADGRIYAWGDDADTDKANYNMVIGTTSPVGCFIYGNSPYHISDMIGNVWEWCADIYGREAYGKPVCDDPVYMGNKFVCIYDMNGSDIYGDKRASRVLRGGSWFHVPADVRCANRYYFPPGNRDNYLGFRLLRTP